MTFTQKLAKAKEAGRQARRAKTPLEKNPYTNRGGGRAYYRAWRSGWLELAS
jgi:hypothetical protein